jgi:hypothetical protein
VRVPVSAGAHNRSPCRHGQQQQLAEGTVGLQLGCSALHGSPLTPPLWVIPHKCVGVAWVKDHTHLLTHMGLDAYQVL